MADLRCGPGCYYWRAKWTGYSNGRCVYPTSMQTYPYPASTGNACSLNRDALVHRDGVLQDIIADATSERKAIAAMLAAMPKEAGQGA